MGGEGDQSPPGFASRASPGPNGARTYLASKKPSLFPRQFCLGILGNVLRLEWAMSPESEIFAVFLNQPPYLLLADVVVAVLLPNTLGRGLHR